MHGPNLARLLTQQRALPCRSHGHERCPERDRRCPHCPLDGASATRFRASPTIRTRWRRLRHRLSTGRLALEQGLSDNLGFYLFCLIFCLLLAAYLGYRLAFHLAR